MSLLKDKEFIEVTGRIQREFAMQSLDAESATDHAYFKGARDFFKELYKLSKKANEIK